MNNEIEHSRDRQAQLNLVRAVNGPIASASRNGCDARRAIETSRTTQAHVHGQVRHLPWRLERERRFAELVKRFGDAYEALDRDELAAMVAHMDLSRQNIEGMRRYLEIETRQVTNTNLQLDRVLRELTPNRIWSGRG